MRFLLAASCFLFSLTSWANPRIKQPLIARNNPAAKDHLAAVLSLQTAAVVTYHAVSEATRVDESASEESSSKPAVLVISDWSIACWEHAGVNVVEFFYHGSQVLAIGLKHPSGDVTWTHAIGRGPLGPCFLKDLTGQGNDYFIFTDHLGTPFAWHNPDTGETTYTPFNPWGELLATPTSGYSPYEHGNVPTSGFALPTFEVFDVTPLGLAGHIYDEKTGLVYMHHRYLHPRLGHFLTPDFRAPDIYDPSTFTEPYAYAKGNPVMYFDPNGLIGVFFDGTWNDATDPKFGDPTNVAKLFALYSGPKRQYIKGVGTGFFFGEDSKVLDFIDNISGGFSGTGAKDRLEFMWSRFEEYFREQILRYLHGEADADLSIDIFGFSRGSAEARTFANMINERGISFEYQGEEYHFTPNIRFLGVFDTVASFGMPGDDDEFDYINLINAPNVQYIRHLTAEDEFRYTFPLTTVADGHQPIIINGHRRVLEESMRGVHSDIGGGYPDDLLSHVALRWMWGQADSLGVPLRAVSGWDAVVPAPQIYEDYIHDSMDKWMYFSDQFHRWWYGAPRARSIFNPNVKAFENKIPYKKTVFSSNEELLDLLVQGAVIDNMVVFHPLP